MTIDVVAQLIGSFGFPIFVSIALGWYVNKQTEQNRSDIKEMQTSYNKDIKLLTETVNNNTSAVEKLCLLIDKKDGD